MMASSLVAAPTRRLRALVRVAAASPVARSPARFLSSATAPPSDKNDGTAKASGATDAAAPDATAADASASASAAAAPASDPQGVLSKPIKNLRDMMDAIDILVEEAEKKVEKKYRPNMIAEFKQLNDTDGKVLEGGAELIPVDKARRVPALQAKSLAGTAADVAQVVAKQPATLVLSSFKNFGLDMLPAWREPFLQEFAATKGVQVVGLNIIEDWYMKLVSGSIVSGLKEKTPVTLQAATYAHFGRCDDFRTALDLYNSFVGYVHLIDNKGRVRWIAGGPATPLELERLFKVTRELLAQQKQGQQRRR